MQASNPQATTLPNMPFLTTRGNKILTLNENYTVRKAIFVSECQCWCWCQCRDVDEKISKWPTRTVTQLFFKRDSKLNETMKLFTPIILPKFPSGKAESRDWHNSVVNGFFQSPFEANEMFYLPNKFVIFNNQNQPLKCVRQSSYLDLWSHTFYIIWQGVHLLVKLQARRTDK